MRELKFRAWDLDEMHYHVAPIKYDQVYDITNNIYRKVEGIMQFTGLKDKNGIEIYEGDIVRILYTDWPSNTDPNIMLEDYLISISDIGVCDYKAPEFGIRMLKEDRYGDRPLCSFNYGAHGRLEVIGNKLENPELLNA